MPSDVLGRVMIGVGIALMVWVLTQWTPGCEFGERGVQIRDRMVCVPR